MVSLLKALFLPLHTLRPLVFLHFTNSDSPSLFQGLCDSSMCVWNGLRSSKKRQLTNDNLHSNMCDNGKRQTAYTLTWFASSYCLKPIMAVLTTSVAPYTLPVEGGFVLSLFRLAARYVRHAPSMGGAMAPSIFHLQR